MEKSKQFDDIIALGKLLVDELQLNQSRDTLGSWMAHHIAEMIQNTESFTGQKKTEAENRCREAVLSLWEHISHFPRGSRPLADIEPLITTIEALDPDNSANYYFSNIQNQLNCAMPTEEAECWLEMAQGIDYSARLLIGRYLKNAADEIAQDNSSWLDLAESLDADLPFTIVVKFIANTDQQHEDEKDQIRRIEKLIDQRERLEAFVLLSQKLVQKIDEEITDLQS